MAVVGIWALYRVTITLYREFRERANLHIAARNFAKSGKVEEQELPYCTCGDRHKEPMCYD